MPIKHLPLVPCFHIMQFEHSHVRKMLRKLDQYVQSPFSLDMGQYLSSTVVRSRYGNRVFALENDPPPLSLEGVVSPSTRSSQWYKCDDAWITEVDESVVRAL